MTSTRTERLGLDLAQVLKGPAMLDTIAIVLERPEELALKRLDLSTPGEHDMLVRTRWSGISTGTERLLYSGRMPTFPGMGYPLVPGYETVGEVLAAPKGAGV